MTSEQDPTAEIQTDTPTSPTTPAPSDHPDTADAPASKQSGIANSDATTPDDAPSDLPPGDHPLEIAARSGYGPLSPQATIQWHGNGMPCVTCGQLVLRNTTRCDYCEQDLSPAMLEKMKAHAGPWYVLEHIRPFPGISLDRIIRQIRRGLITETSIVRGPSSDFQWRFAVETPGLCRYFERCWQCHEQTTPADAYCPSCLAHLTFEKPRNTSQGPPEAAVGIETLANSTTSPLPIEDNHTNPTAPTKPTNPQTLTPAHQPAPQTSIHQTTALPNSLSPTGMIESVSPAGGEIHNVEIHNVLELQKLSAVVNGMDTRPQEITWDEPPRVGGVRTTWIAITMMAVVIIALLLVTRSRTRMDPTTSPHDSPTIVLPDSSNTNPSDTPPPNMTRP